MERTRRWFQEFWVYPLISFAVITASSCNSSPASSGAREAGAAAASNNAGTHIDVMCVGERINNPPESFHYSYVYTDASSSVDKEADITDQDMTITIKDKSGSHSYHGARSDETSWDRAVLDLSGLNITAMSSRLNSLNGTSAIVSRGADAVNNYSTTKYTIDTTSANSSDKRKFDVLFGGGSFEKGTIWMGADGCAVKLALDEGIWRENGDVNKVHYEMARIKK
jgi:hypothetical protein